jgi:uncharacterized protein with PhoU and TrkA domain
VAVRRGEAWIHSPDRDTELRGGDVLICRGPDEGVAGVYETLTGDPFESPTIAAESPGPDARSAAAEDPSPVAEPRWERVADADGLADLDRAVETLMLMKTVSELAVDLAYSSVLFDDAALAEEVRALEVEVDALESRFEAWTLRAAAVVSDPVDLRGLLHIATSTEVISDAAVEISEGVLRGIGTHPVVQAAVEESDEVLVRQAVTTGGLAGETVGDLTRSVAGLRVLAVRRDESDERDKADDGTDSDDWSGTDISWLLSPDEDEVLRAGDTLVVKGTRASIDRLADLA